LAKYTRRIIARLHPHQSCSEGAKCCDGQRKQKAKGERERAEAGAVRRGENAATETFSIIIIAYSCVPARHGPSSLGSSEEGRYQAARERESGQVACRAVSKKEPKEERERETNTSQLAGQFA